MKNSLNKYIFLNILFLMGVWATADICVAKPNSKRASRQKPSARKKVSSPSSETTTATSGESSGDRSANGVTTARPGRVTTTTATSSSAVDDDTAAELLATNLLACLQYPCNGDIDYEKCFGNGKPEAYIRSNTTCLGMYNGAANDVIRVKGMNIVNTKIKSYFAEACEGAGGKINGNQCKINVCYQARGGNHTSPTKCMEYSIGKQVTCSAIGFGLSQQDLEYKEEMNSEQIGTIIQAGMQTLSGLLETGVAIAETVQASKKLKSGSDVKGKDCWGDYKHGSESITGVKCKDEWTKCPDGKKKSCNCDASKQKTDSAGNYYCVDEDKNKDKKPTEKWCKSIKASEWGNATTKECYAEISEYTDVAVQEQEASLYKKFTDFNKLKMQDKIDQLKQGAMYAGLQQEISKFGQSTYEDCSIWVGSSRGYDINNNFVYKGCAIVATDYNKDHPDNTVDPNACIERQSSCTCKLTTKECKKAIKKDDGYYLEKPFDYTKEGDKLTQRINDIDSAMKTDANGKEKQTLSSATETFNSMQKKVNEKKQELSSLEEKKNAGMQKAISSGAQTLTQAGSSLTMTIVNANNNIGTMTGACYIGDPKSGGAILFMNENEVKKLSWKNL